MLFKGVQCSSRSINETSKTVWGSALRPDIAPALFEEAVPRSVFFFAVAWAERSRYELVRGLMPSFRSLGESVW